jgi:hypothetical protein
VNARLLRLAGASAIVALLAACSGGAGDSRVRDAGRVPLPIVQAAAKGEKCIADPATMRRDHPRMLSHQRDATVHLGERGARASLKGCIDCHASRASGSVAARSGDFCQSCHQYAAVTIDCFECHSARPAEPVATAAPARPPATGGGS